MARQVESRRVPATPLIFDPYSDDVRREPYPWYRELLENEPLHKGAHDLWYAARYSDVREIMADPRFGRSEFRTNKLAVQGPGPLSEVTAHTLFYLDPPDHGRLHGLVKGAISPRVIRELQPLMHSLVEQMLDAAGDSEMDVIAELAQPFPLRIIGQLMGMPVEDLDRMHEWGLALDETTDPVLDPTAVARGHARMGEYIDYMRRLLAERRQRPGEDLLSRLLQSEPDEISEDEIIAMVMVLVNAGHETTTDLIGNGLLALMRHPSELRKLRDNPSLTRTAVEECLRYDSPVQQNARVVQADHIEIQGQPIPRGEIIVVLQGAANHDPREFASPEKFDITRSPNRHVSFGRGMRFCVGAPLARMEGAIALAATVARLEGVRLAVSDDQLRYAPSSLFHGVESLPVTYSKS
jgi:orsellenic acid P450 oxidase